RSEANVQTHLKLKPGEYEVRVGVSDPATGVVASVFGPVTVPRFDNASLSLSDVIVEAANGAATTRRRLERDERFRAVVEVHQGTQRTSAIAPVSVRTSILDANGRAARDQVLALSAKDFPNRRAALALDLGQLPPGDYTLTIDASLDRQRASRVVRFAV